MLDYAAYHDVQGDLKWALKLVFIINFAWKKNMFN